MRKVKEYTELRGGNNYFYQYFVLNEKTNNLLFVELKIKHTIFDQLDFERNVAKIFVQVSLFSENDKEELLVFSGVKFEAHRISEMKDLLKQHTVYCNGMTNKLNKMFLQVLYCATAENVIKKLIAKFEGI